MKELEIYFSLIDRIKKTTNEITYTNFYKKFDLVICNSVYLGRYLKKKYGVYSKTLFPPSITGLKIKRKKKTKKVF